MTSGELQPCGVPAPRWLRTSRVPGSRHSTDQFAKDSLGIRFQRAGPHLAVVKVSVVVFRATVLSIVLVFAAGPSASLFCKAWCDPAEAAASGCHHQESASVASVADDGSCRDTIQGGAILTKEDLRRASSQDLGNVTAIAPPPLAPAAIGLRASGNQRRAPSALKRPPTTPLRI